VREFHDADGALWRVEEISHGRTSEYLNRKVHQPILQFSCLSHRRPRRYVGHASDRGELDACSAAELQLLLERASVH
jgi:hypothetical protein